MPHCRGLISFLLAFLIFANPSALAQDGLVKDVGFLSSPLCGGRASGTVGASEAARYILRRLEKDGYSPSVQCFTLPADKDGNKGIGRNVIAEIRRPGTSRWVVLTAFYDGMGEMDGKLFPGADSNASGVAGLLAIADSLGADSTPSILKGCNVLLAFLDGNNREMSGAQTFWKKYLSGRNIRMVVDLDIIGSSLAPVKPYHKEFLMVIGADQHRKTLDALASGQGLMLYYQYYMSRDFTEMFYRRMGSRKVFLEHDLPVVWFTSGITMNTNRTTDTAETLDYDQFRRRIALIVAWLRKI